MEELGLRLNCFIKANFNAFVDIIGKDKVTSNSFEQEFRLEEIIPKLKFFVSKPEVPSDYYFNYVMLLFGLNKKLFVKEYRVEEFVKSIKEWLEK